MKKGKAEIKRFLLWIIGAMILVFIFQACHNALDMEVETRNLIPEKDFSSILSDLYITDGLLTLPGLSEKFSGRDSVKNYMDVISSHGYTYNDMSRTLKYYFIRKPKKLVKIYDHILGVFTEMESRYESEATAESTKRSNSWNGSPAYNYPSNATTGTGFIMELRAPLTFRMEFSVLAYPDDITLDPRFTAWYTNADSLETGKRIYLPEIKYTKDGQLHTYNFSVPIPSKGNVVIKGNLLDFDNNADPQDMHISIYNISCSTGAPAV